MYRAAPRTYEGRVFVDHEQVGESDSHLLFYVSWPTGVWQTGEYEVRLIVNGEEKMVLPFSVR